MRKKKSTQQLVGIESVTDSSVLTAGGELTFYLVQPTNLNVLPESGVRTRVTALLNVLKTSAEMELLALDSKESYQDNRLYYRRRAEEEGNPASERFKTILAQQAELKVKRAELEQQQAEDAELTSHMKLAADTLIQADTAIMKWDEYQIRALVESVRILSNDEILVRLKSGIEKIERLQK